MENQLVWLGIPIFLILFLLQESLCLSIVRRVYAVSIPRTKGMMLIALLGACLAALCGAFHLPLFFLYLCLMLFCYVGFRFVTKWNSLQYQFWTNTYFICILSVHLVIVAVLALIADTTLYGVCASSSLWLLSGIVALAVVNGCFWLLDKKRIETSLRHLLDDEKRLRQLVQFEWFALGYLLLDSLPSLFVLPYHLLSWFLIGSSLLLLLQFGLYLYYTIQIAEGAHFEAEYLELEQKREELLRREMELRHLTYIDTLTGAYTRRYGMEMLQTLMKEKRRFALAYIDLNGLKTVNDTMGHAVGDRYLILVANTLNETLRKQDILCRVGGDEFVVIAPNEGKEALEGVLDHANQAFGKVSLTEFPSSFSFGVIISDGQTQTEPEELFRKADILMYQHKRQMREGMME